ncbi:gluconate 2-dehydrogenase subunit 3 family protein [Colwellia echini]|uniref:Gluconate 2-dehydrogenase subunit 3 family protein n=1 Tax=Colwellia echini TaxID=1982103 RepID=A0ABY3MUG5_9GAMM|nr:gluconate 2-dehydrogenase subunit 3 family protein [Colwellia echini]TYK64840.1 gluconate 2-dehydrogenase subunit 3 family protein [Colwellia echini]
MKYKNTPAMTSTTIARNQTSRRRFLKGFSAMFGCVAGSMLTGNAVSVAMAYTPNADSILSDGKVFDKNQLMLLKEICSIVIPKTDTLGAAELDGHGFIDNQLFHCHTKAEQERAVAVLTMIDNTSQQQLSNSFLMLTPEQQFQLLTELDLGEKNFNQAQRADFKVLKQYICFSYYTSIVGATQELRYDPVPGGFKGSIPYKETDSSWATNGLFH